MRPATTPAPWSKRRNLKPRSRRKWGEHREYADAIIWLGIMHGRLAATPKRRGSTGGAYSRSTKRRWAATASRFGQPRHRPRLRNECCEASTSTPKGSSSVALASWNRSRARTSSIWPTPSSAWPMSTSCKASTRESEGLYKRTLAIREQALGANHPEVALPSTTWPTCTRRRASTPTLKATTGVRGDPRAALGDEPATTSPTSLIGLAHLYVARARYADAEGLYKRALAIKEQALGADNPMWRGPSTSWPSCIGAGKACRRRGALKARAGDQRKGEGASHPRGGYPQQSGHRVSAAAKVRRRRGALQARARDLRGELRHDHSVGGNSPQQPGQCSTRRKTSMPTPRSCISERWRSAKRPRREPPGRGGDP